MPAVNRRLVTDCDMQDAMDRGVLIRVFEQNHIVQSGGTIVRFDDRTVVIQAGVSDVTYYARSDCEFFELKRS